ncbi:MAG: hypothetical protein SPE35_05295 [Butyricicoccus sp.]|nr:hypothetical protein [Butyricicoccus sp.]
MTVAEQMKAAGVTPKLEYEGEVKTNFMILGVAYVLVLQSIFLLHNKIIC